MARTDLTVSPLWVGSHTLHDRPEVCVEPIRPPRRPSVPRKAGWLRGLLAESVTPAQQVHLCLMTLLSTRLNHDMSPILPPRAHSRKASHACSLEVQNDAPPLTRGERSDTRWRSLPHEREGPKRQFRATAPGYASRNPPSESCIRCTVALYCLLSTFEDRITRQQDHGGRWKEKIIYYFII